MQVLANVAGTPEQLQLSQHRYLRGPLIIRGAAGSGKTTTALLRLRELSDFWTQALAHTEKRSPNILVLTFNRTLRGYVTELAREQAGTTENVLIDTFAGWARSLLGPFDIIPPDDREDILHRLARQAGLRHTRRFIVDEVTYATGRLLPSSASQGF